MIECYEFRFFTFCKSLAYNSLLFYIRMLLLGGSENNDVLLLSVNFLHVLIGILSCRCEITDLVCRFPSSKFSFLCKLSI